MTVDRRQRRRARTRPRPTASPTRRRRRSRVRPRRRLHRGPDASAPPTAAPPRPPARRAAPAPLPSGAPLDTAHARRRTASRVTATDANGVATTADRELHGRRAAARHDHRPGQAARPTSRAATSAASFGCAATRPGRDRALHGPVADGTAIDTSTLGPAQLHGHRDRRQRRRDVRHRRLHGRRGAPDGQRPAPVGGGLARAPPRAAAACRSARRSRSRSTRRRRVTLRFTRAAERPHRRRPLRRGVGRAQHAPSCIRSCSRRHRHAQGARGHRHASPSAGTTSSRRPRARHLHGARQRDRRGRAAIRGRGRCASSSRARYGRADATSRRRPAAALWRDERSGPPGCRA